MIAQIYILLVITIYNYYKKQIIYIFFIIITFFSKILILTIKIWQKKRKNYVKMIETIIYHKLLHNFGDIIEIVKLLYYCQVIYKFKNIYLGYIIQR